MADGIVFQDLDNRRVELERHKENASRTAEATGRFRSTGTGSLEFPTRIDFGVTFVTKPGVSYGSEIDVDELEGVLENYAGDNDYTDEMKALFTPDNGTPMLPFTSGFVTDWDTDQKGFFIGAWCGVRVGYGPILGTVGEAVSGFVIPEPQVVVIHHFRFSAVGMKDVPTALTD